MHAVLVLFRPLPNVGIQNLGMSGMYNLAKATEALKIHCQSPSRGLGNQQWSH